MYVQILQQNEKLHLETKVSSVNVYVTADRKWYILSNTNYRHLLPRGGGGGTPLFGLHGDVPLDRVWFFGLAVLNRVYNLTCLCPTQGQNLS